MMDRRWAHDGQVMTERWTGDGLMMDKAWAYPNSACNAHTPLLCSPSHRLEPWQCNPASAHRSLPCSAQNKQGLRENVSRYNDRALLCSAQKQHKMPDEKSSQSRRKTLLNTEAAREIKFRALKKELQNRGGDGHTVSKDKNLQGLAVLSTKAVWYNNKRQQS
eukprot:1144275-Pelagomonas_calceolata.AAC.5